MSCVTVKRSNDANEGICCRQLLPARVISSNKQCKKKKKKSGRYWTKPVPIPEAADTDKICFTLYTVHNKTLKLTAQLYPLYPKEARKVRLELERVLEVSPRPLLLRLAVGHPAEPVGALVEQGSVGDHYQTGFLTVSRFNLEWLTDGEDGLP